jgi:cell division protein ZapA
MERKAPVSLTVGGQSFKVHASVPEETLRRLAAVVDSRIRELVPPGRPVPPTAMLLAAVALAHDLEEERSKRTSLEARSRDVMRRLLARIDEALEESPEPVADVEDDQEPSQLDDG